LRIEVCYFTIRTPLHVYKPACSIDKFMLLSSVFRVWRSSVVDHLFNTGRFRRNCALSVTASRCSLKTQVNMLSSGDVTTRDASKTADDAKGRFRKPVFPVPVVPMRIDDSNPTDGARELLKIIRPEWPADRLRFTVLCVFKSLVLVSHSWSWSHALSL